ncbi:MAG: hypothetical protein M3342_23365, partial [Bacteroidota bacterium]|nr:hypothetical protein [Bacteroidota bacterium]
GNRSQKRFFTTASSNNVTDKHFASCEGITTFTALAFAECNTKFIGRAVNNTGPLKIRYIQVQDLLTC